jgi:hypothetical protein
VRILSFDASLWRMARSRARFGEFCATLLCK